MKVLITVQTQHETSCCVVHMGSIGLSNMTEKTVSSAMQAW